MCYNTTYKSPPKVRWARLELADRLHGSALQTHRVCHSTTSAPTFLFDFLYYLRYHVSRGKSILYQNYLLNLGTIYQ